MLFMVNKGQSTITLFDLFDYVVFFAVTLIPATNTNDIQLSYSLRSVKLKKITLSDSAFQCSLYANNVSKQNYRKW